MLVPRFIKALPNQLRILHSVVKERPTPIMDTLSFVDGHRVDAVFPRCGGVFSPSCDLSHDVV